MGNPAKSLRALLTGVVDYAGLFPPASLDLPAAKRNYAAYRDGEWAWMLGRFVVPAAKVGDVDPSWPLAVLHTQPRRMEVAGAGTDYEIGPDESVAGEGRGEERLGGGAVTD